MPDKFKNRYRIPSARLSNWEYSSNAAYFITICTANRQHFFGEIKNDEMQLSTIGEIANQCWLNIPNHFPYFYLDEFIVMPNHIHGIVLIEKPYYEGTKYKVDNGTTDADRTVVVVETGHALTLQSDSQQPTEQKQESKLPHPRFRNQGKNTISSMVSSFKSAVTKQGNENKLPFGWQSRFHDHIIRDNDEFIRIRNYVINNAANWKEDKFYSD